MKGHSVSEMVMNVQEVAQVVNKIGGLDPNSGAFQSSEIALYVSVLETIADGAKDPADLAKAALQLRSIGSPNSP